MHGHGLHLHGMLEGDGLSLAGGHLYHGVGAQGMQQLAALQRRGLYLCGDGAVCSERTRQAAEGQEKRGQTQRGKKGEAGTSGQGHSGAALDLDGVTRAAV